MTLKDTKVGNEKAGGEFFSVQEYEWPSPITEYVLLTIESLAEQMYGTEHGIRVEQGSRGNTFRMSCPKSGQQEALMQKLNEMFTQGDPEVVARAWEHINRKIIVRTVEQETLIRGMLVGTVCEAEIASLRLKYQAMFQHLTPANCDVIADELWNREAAVSVTARLTRSGLDPLSEPEILDKAKEFFKSKLAENSRPGQM